MKKPERQRHASTAVVVLGLILAAAAARLHADIAATPAWRIGGGVTTALVHGTTVFVAGPFTQLYTPSSSEDQFYDPNTGQVQARCARSTTTRPLTGTPDGTGGLLVTVREGDAFADFNGAYPVSLETAIVRIGNDCLWDRQFAAPGVDPTNPSDLTIGLPVRVGNVVFASNAVVVDFFLRAQVSAYDATSGARLAYQFYPGISEIGLLGGTATLAIARVRGSNASGYTLGSITPGTMALAQTLTSLADETASVRTWVRGQTMYRARPAPSSRLEAYDLTTLAPKSGWTAPVVAGLTDLEVVGPRVFLTAGVIDSQTVAQAAALLEASGAIDTTWIPAPLTRRTADPSGQPYVPALTALASDGQRLYMSGDFERVAGGDRVGVAALSASTGGLDAWDPAPFLVSPLEYTAGGLLMTRPTGTNLVTRRYVAAIDRVTGVVTPWNPNDSGRTLQHQPSPVSALAADGTYLYFASATTGEVLRADLATADVDQAWRVTARRTGGQAGAVTNLIVVGEVVYLGGDFDVLSGPTIGTASRHDLAAVGTNGALTPWAPALEGSLFGTLVRSMIGSGNTIYLGGDFTSVATQFRPGFAAVDSVSGALAQPEMAVIGETRLYGLATDGAQTFVAGVMFGAPLVGAASIPDSVLTAYGPTGGVVPQSAAFVKGKLYAGREYDIQAGTQTERQTQWGTVFADDNALVHLPDGDGTLDYYPALPGSPPDPPTLTALATGNRVDLSWTRALTGGVPTSYTLQVGSTPGATGLATFLLRGTSFTTTAPNGFYYLTLVARNGDGASAPSSEVALQVGCFTAPPAPGTLTFTTAGTTAALHWGAAATAAGYVLEAGRAPGTSDFGAMPLPNTTTLVASVAPGVYYARLRAVNACGLSPASNEIAVTLDGSVVVPNPPTGLTAAVSGGVAGFTWTPPASGGTPAGYWLEAGTTPGGVIAVVPSAVPSLAVSAAPRGTYYVRVRAYNAAGIGGASAEVLVVVP
ncbi:MAG: fibronectin type III domain-containing protein [Acidobacteriota bacterium]